MKTTKTIKSIKTMNIISRTVSDNKIVYLLSLSTRSLPSLINPYLFVEKLTDALLLKLPNIKVKIVQNTKSSNQSFLQLKCFCSNNTPDYQVNNLQEEIGFIAATLRDELIDRIESAQRSVA